MAYYDPFGRRILKRVAGDDDGESKTYRYYYDNEDIVAEYIDKDGHHNDGHHEHAKSDVTRYIHGPGIDEPLAVEQKRETYYYHADGLGSIVALTDKKAKVVQSYDYDSFGNMHQRGDRVKQPYTFTGREYDRETGLYYYRARYYDARAGRFTQVDPILRIRWNKTGDCGGYLDNPQERNQYAYTLNNPLIYTDPYGEACKDVDGCLDCFKKNGNSVLQFYASKVTWSCDSEGLYCRNGKGKCCGHAVPNSRQISITDVKGGNCEKPCQVVAHEIAHAFGYDSEAMADAWADHMMPECCK